MVSRIHSTIRTWELPFSVKKFGVFFVAFALMVSGIGAAWLVTPTSARADETEVSILELSDNMVAVFDYVMATAVVRDELGIPIADVEVSISLFNHGSGAPLGSQSCWTDDDGMCSLGLTAYFAGQFDVKASYVDPDTGEEIPVGEPQLLVIGSTSYPAQMSFEVSAGEPVFADGIAAWVGTVVLRDGAGDPIPVVTVNDLTFDVSPEVSVSEVTDEGDGLFTVLFTSETPGTYQVSAEFRSNYQIGTPQEITFAPVVSVVQASMWVSDGPVDSDGVSAGVVTVELVRVVGSVSEPVSGLAANLKAFPPDWVMDRTEVSGFSETATAGVYTATVKSTVAGDQQIKAYFNPDGSVTTPEDVFLIAAAGNDVVRFRMLPVEPATSTFELSDNLVAVFDYVTATAVVRELGIPIADVEVSISLFNHGSGVPLGAQSCWTDDDGMCSLGLTAYIAGQFDVKASYVDPDTGEEIPVGEPQLLVIGSTGYPAQMSFEVSAREPVFADGIAAWLGTVVLRDGAGDPIPVVTAYDLTFDVADEVSVSEVIDEGDGLFTVLFTSETPGTYQVSAEFRSIYQIGIPQEITFTTATPIMLPSGTLTLSHSSIFVTEHGCGYVNANPEVITATATVVDGDGLPLAGVRVDFDVDSTLVFEDASWAVSDELGLAQVQLKYGGTPYASSVQISAVLDGHVPVEP
ncbi:MAG: hypothetical protein FWG47_07815, partial [Propionibacteriaceae bacterium]|nr:hypothetical protein [Propionibacteriaceae bacterium]